MSDQQLGVAILGCGYWGSNYVRLFDELPEAQVIAICDQRATRLQEVGPQCLGVKLLTTEVEEVLRLKEVQAVAVCTEASSHYELVRRCLLAGKHVLVEKPLTKTATEAEELNELAKTMGVILMVGHTFLYNAGIRKVKELINQAQVGQVYYLYARRTNLGPIRQDVNALWDLAPHDVSIFNYLLDSTPEWVSAVGVKVLKNCHEDVGFVSLGYPGDIVGHIHVSWADPNKVREVVVVGSDKRIVFNDLNLQEQVRIFEKGVAPIATNDFNDGVYDFMMRDGDIISPRIEVSEPLKNQCYHFLECVRRGSYPLTGGREGQEVIRVMEAIDRSLARRGVPVEVIL